MMEEKIKKLIKEAISNIDPYFMNIFSESTLEHPENFKNGEFSTNIAMVSFRSIAKRINSHVGEFNWADMAPSPKNLAEKIVDELNKNLPKEISKIEAKNGFINFYLSPEFFAESIKEILEKKENYGKNENGKGKKVLVEYSSPNIAKPFSIGHLRSTIIGDSVAKILEFSGYEVIRDNHLGDWGTQFGKMIVAIKKWGDLDALEKDLNPIKTLVDLYVKFHEEAEKNKDLEDQGREWFKKLEQKDPEALNIWQKCISYSMKEFERIYERLGVSRFDTTHGESFYEDKMSTVITDVKEKGIGKESEGAFIVEFSEDKKLPPLLLLKKDGSSLYALRDLATDKWRKSEYGNDIKIINEVGMEQKEYFRQIFETEEMLGYFRKEDRIHIAHGLYRFKDGKMSTRKGNVIWLDDIINEAVERAGKINENVAEVVGVGAIKFNDLKREISKDIIFDWEEIVNINGASGPYLQYSYARAKSILEKAVTEKVISLEHGYFSTEKFLVLAPSRSQVSIETTFSDLERLLYRFPEIVLRSAEEFAPHHIATYLIDLARAFNTFYGEGKIVDKDDIKSPYRIALTDAFSVVMKNGLYLLGIESPGKM